MAEPPTSTEVLAALQALPPTELKIVGGLATLMIANPQSVRDSEWISERVVELTVLAEHHPAEGAPAATSADVERVRAFVQERIHDLVGHAMQLFVRTALDLQQTGMPFSFADARAVVLGYVGSEHELPLKTDN